MGLARLIVEVLDSEAVDAGRGLPKTFDVQFNPETLVMIDEPVYAATPVPGLLTPITTFSRGESQSLQIELMFDVSRTDSDVKDVRELTGPFAQLAIVQPKTHAPPRVRIAWGEGLAFTGIAAQIEQRLTYFAENGVPIQATLDVVFRRYISLRDQLHQLNLQSSDHTKVIEIKAGETLAGIAAREYGDPRYWRLIADANRGRIDNPRRLEPGARLRLPPGDGKTFRTEANDAATG
jgi:nucleoid-associated protein YgaU